MNLKLNGLKTFENWVALLTLIVTISNLGLLIVGIPLALTQPYSTKIIEQYISMNTGMLIIIGDLILTLIWYILISILKKNNNENSQKGFVIPLIIAIVAILVIIGGMFTYQNKKAEAPVINNQATSTASTTDKLIGGDNITNYFSSPQKDAGFGFGDIIHIKWDPSVIDASTIDLSCSDSTECSGNNYQIYSRQNLNDSVSIEGSLSYLVPNNYLGPTPGQYRIVVYSYGQRTNIKSEEFTIIPPAETAPKTTNPQYIQSIYGQKGKYMPGESIKVFVDARDYNGAPASPDRGFNIQAHIFDSNNYPGPSFQAVNASYDEKNNLWEIDMSAPTDKSLIYNLQISLYCGYVGLNSSNGLSSVCAQEHGTANDSQLDKTISFLVQSTTSATCTPNWTCGWAPCTNGYQGMTATDTNNCGLPSTGVQIACPALARQCSN